MDLLSTYKFAKSYLGHLENINSLRQIFQMLTYFIILNKKVILTKYSSPIKNVFVRCQSYSDRHEFFNFLIFTRKCEFYYWYQILSAVFLHMKGSFYSYFDMSARQPNLNNHKFVYLALSGKDEALRKNCLVQLTTEDNHTSFPPPPSTSPPWDSLYGVQVLFGHKIIKKMSTQGLKLLIKLLIIKISNLLAFKGFFCKWGI